jgi:hypothetical protein
MYVFYSVFLNMSLLQGPKTCLSVYVIPKLVLSGICLLVKIGRHPCVYKLSQCCNLTLAEMVMIVRKLLKALACSGQ